MSQAPTARNVALDLISAVLRRRRPLDDAIEDNPAMHELAGRDRAFARLLVATVLRRLGQIAARYRPTFVFAHPSARGGGDQRRHRP
jgi:16S rRNA (cytosine967-C5)-methyltransferase